VICTLRQANKSRARGAGLTARMGEKMKEYRL
jgi:hypothetical protein